VLAFYADESGSFDPHDLGRPWVVLLAIGFDDDDWLTIDEAFDGLKRWFFPFRPPAEVEIRSNAIRMALVRPDPRNPFSSLAPGKLARFGTELYRIIDGLPFVWNAAVVHKPTAARDFGCRSNHDVFALAYTSLIALIDERCRRVKRPARLFMDQQERSIEGSAHDEIARFNYRYRDGQMEQHRTRIIERPYFQDSTRSNHMQLADILAYNVLRHCRERKVPYPYFARILPKRYNWTVLGPENDVPG
jgi:hypothetical protein